MTMEQTTYHKLLRVSSVVFTCVLLFQSGVVHPITAQLSRETAHYMANAVGVTVGVEPTELNQITADITKRENALAAREKDVQAREISVGIAPGGATITQTTMTFVLSTVVFILLVLMILNYVLDFVRARRIRALQSKLVVQ
jgi:hypothetical protein